MNLILYSFLTVEYKILLILGVYFTFHHVRTSIKTFLYRLLQLMVTVIRKIFQNCSLNNFIFFFFLSHNIYVDQLNISIISDCIRSHSEKSNCIFHLKILRNNQMSLRFYYYSILAKIKLDEFTITFNLL